MILNNKVNPKQQDYPKEPPAHRLQNTKQFQKAITSYKIPTYQNPEHCKVVQRQLSLVAPEAVLALQVVGAHLVHH